MLLCCGLLTDGAVQPGVQLQQQWRGGAGGRAGCRAHAARHAHHAHHAHLALRARARQGRARR